MTVDHKQQLTNFINGMIAQGVPADKAQAIAQTLLADDTVTKYFSSGVLAQNLLDQKMQSLRTLEQQLQQNQTQWNAYLQQANTTLSQSEREKLEAVEAKAAAETAIKALAQQYNIPESEVRAIYSPTTVAAIGLQTQQTQQPQQVQSPQFQQTQQQTQQQYLTAEDLQRQMLQLVQGIGERDSIASKHFALTNKPWDSSRAMNYIQQQAQLGNQLTLEQAWRITEGIDAIEASAAAKAREDEKAAIRREVEAELAQKGNQIPTDAQPNFAEARLSSILNPQAPANGDAQQQQQRQEQVGHHGRTQAARQALFNLQQARRLGQASPYDQPAT